MSIDNPSRDFKRGNIEILITVACRRRQRDPWQRRYRQRRRSRRQRRRLGRLV